MIVKEKTVQDNAPSCEHKKIIKINYNIKKLHMRKPLTLFLEGMSSPITHFFTIVLHMNPNLVWYLGTVLIVAMGGVCVVSNITWELT